jgi:Xaa-Pro aminopeptidase
MLTREGCQARQERFLRRLEEAGIGAALIAAPRDIFYFTGVLPESGALPYPSLLFLGPGLSSWLITGKGDGDAVVDDRVVYETGTFATHNPDNARRVQALARDRFRAQNSPTHLGFQREELPYAFAEAATSASGPEEWVEIDELLQEQQLRKDPDEVECIQRAVNANLAAYARAPQVIRPGVTELEVMTECHMAALRQTGEPHYFNGDFQSGQLGGQARNRPIEAGELYIIDAWSDVGGYWSDMSRAWCVGEPTDLQVSVYEHIATILRDVPNMARVGRDTMDLWRELDERIREHPHLAKEGLIHHGGHGLGLRVHEFPDLNRDRGGVFEVGNVFTCEPGAYSAELRGGVRLENNFYISPEGVKNLSDTPLTLRTE